MSKFDTTGNQQAADTNFTAEVNIAATLEVQRFAEGVAEHFRSKVELDRIAGYRINPEYEYSNYQQQAGTAAEVKHVAHTNAEAIIAGDDARIARTENVGFKQHQEFDFVAVDTETGKPLEMEGGKLSTGAQMKVYDTTEKYSNLYGKWYDKYRRAELVIPKDRFEAVMAEWTADQKRLIEQRDKLIGFGKHGLAQEKQKVIDQIEDARSRAKPSPVSSNDALEARKSPATSVGKDILDVSHRAGMEAARTGAILGGGISLVHNVVAVVRSGKPLDEAAVEVLKGTGKAAAGAYATGAISTAVGGGLRAANNQVLQNLGRSNAPAMAVQVAAMIGKNAIELASGRMSAEDFVRHVTKDGSMLAVSMTGSNLGAVIGTAMFPGVGTIVGGLVGGMAASMLGGHLHAELMRSVANMDASNALSQRVHALCDHVIRQHEAYQLEMHAAFDVFFSEKRQEVKHGFDMISAASADGRSIHDGLSVIALAMNKQLAFDSPEAFSRHLRSRKAIAF